MKIAWASHSSETQGGAERCLWEAAGEMIRRGHEVCAVLPSEGPLVDRLAREGAQVKIIPSPLWVHPRAVRRPPFYYHLRHGPAFLRSARRMTRFLKELKPDLVMTNTITFPAAALSARSAGLPHVWYVHEFGSEDHGLQYHFRESYCLSFMNRYSRRVIVNSKAVFEKYVRFIPAAKLRVAYLGVPAAPELAVQDTRVSALPLRVLLMGRIAASKGPEDAIRATALLRSRGRAIRLSLVGSQIDNRYVESLHDLSRKLGVGDAVEFAAPTDDPFSRYADSDVVLVCSRMEAFGRVTVEAMRAGRPVVGASAGGTTELIRDGWNGLLYEPGNVEALADRLAELDENRERMREMGARAKEWADATFTLDAYVERLLGALEEAVAAPA